jgi:hypothetical protein
MTFSLKLYSAHIVESAMKADAAARAAVEGL